MSSDCNISNKNVTETLDKAIAYVKASESENFNVSKNGGKEVHISINKSTNENHFKCVGLNDTSADSIQTDVPFICIYCNNNLLYADLSVQTKTFMS